MALGNIGAIKLTIRQEKKKFDMLPEIEGLTRYIFDFIKKNDLKTDDIIGNMLKFRKKFRSHGTSDPNVIAIKEKMDDMLDSDKTFSRYLKKLQTREIDPFQAGDKITKSLLK